MSKLFFGLAMGDSMFPTDCAVSKTTLSPDKAIEWLERYKEAGTYFSCCNANHANTLEVLKRRHGIDGMPSEGTAPKVSLESGDSLMVFSIGNVPRDKPEGGYTDEQVGNATFTFSLWNVM